MRTNQKMLPNIYKLFDNYVFQKQFNIINDQNKSMDIHTLKTFIKDVFLYNIILQVIKKHLKISFVYK